MHNYFGAMNNNDASTQSQAMESVLYATVGRKKVCIEVALGKNHHILYLARNYFYSHKLEIVYN